MKLNRTLSLCLTVALCATLAIGGTIAFYTAQDTNVNTFILTEGVMIDLDEAKVEKDGDEFVKVEPEERVDNNAYLGIYPGAVMPKDPTVTVLKGSDAAYVRVKVTVSDATEWLHLYGAATVEENFMLLINNKLGDGWSITGYEEMIGDANEGDIVFTILYANALAGEEKTTPVFEHVVFTANVDENTLGLFNGQFQITVMAEAVQADGFVTAADAFAAVDGMMVDDTVTEGDNTVEGQ